MTWDNMIDVYVITPLDLQGRNWNMVGGSWQAGAHIASQIGRFRPLPELSG